MKRLTMKPHQIESWVLNIIEQLTTGKPVEDSRVELKTIFIPPDKAARRIAGHANAARGAPILWIVGVDEKQQRIVGADYEELSEWFEKVKAQFNGLYPELFHINVPVKDKIVVGLLFDTQRAPYVVKNPAFGVERGESVEFEVPWREGTVTRTANRADLLRILSPLQALPTFEILGGFLNANIPRAPQDELYWTFRLELYVEPVSRDKLVIPFHRCKSRCELPVIGWSDLINLSISPTSRTMTNIKGDRWRESTSKTIEETPSEVLISDPGRIICKSEVVTPLLTGSLPEYVRFVISFLPSKSDNAAIIEGLLQIYEPDKGELGRWVYSPSTVNNNATSLLK